MDHGKTTSDLPITHVKEQKSAFILFNLSGEREQKINSVVSRLMRHMTMHNFLTELPAFNELLSQVFRD